MALAEDAASVLEQFIHDVANLPAEIAHLLEEIQAKDVAVQENRALINTRDQSFQRHVKKEGGHVRHQKEDVFIKQVLSHYDKAQALQDEKVVLSEKAALLLDRYVKRLDLKIRDLQAEGAMLSDTPLPSLLHTSTANLVPPASSTSTGTNTPLPGLPPGGSTTIANAAMARMANAAALAARTHATTPTTATQPHPLMTSTSATQKQRETSAGAIEAKRRRLTATLGPLPNPSSALATQPAVAPGTPAAAMTPGSRATSAGPRPKKSMKKPATQQPGARKKPGKTGPSKKAARRMLGGGGTKTETSSGDDESALSDGSASDVDTSVTVVKAPAEDEEMGEAAYEDDGDDTKPYCTCRTISRGNMVACDNENCRFEWFHWECVGLTQEPKGRWLCAECEKLPKNQLKLAR